ncbi:MAG: hypothetical protein HY718_08580 [Planctomycetes bacterium]|nr:hypothetical protein [Planctomycetota bacterium]
MNNVPQVPDHTGTGEITSLSVLAARLTWAFFGPLLLALLTYLIVARGNGWLTPYDAGFGALAGLMVLGRWIEYRSGSATTLTGAEAGGSHFVRYARRFAPLALLVWIAANVLGNYVLT